ncbi:hypothetical protein BDN67DRAFT_1012373 [Paxillus ammoniavirescens]|nr:hypothetical protein BDN67DRAFT_1012373 [Paxillus ammoniavirescens]
MDMLLHRYVSVETFMSRAVANASLGGWDVQETPSTLGIHQKTVSQAWKKQHGRFTEVRSTISLWAQTGLLTLKTPMPSKSTSRASYPTQKLQHVPLDGLHRSLRFCLGRHLFDVAIALYDGMLQEGLVAVNAICLRMTALKVVEHSTKLRETVVSLKEVFEHQG